MTAWPTPNFARYMEHWQSLRDGDAVPLLTSYLDSPLPDLQPWMGIVDIKSETDQPMRLMGTGLVGYFGADATGQNFLALQSPQSLPFFQRAHHQIPHHPCGAIFRGTCSTTRARNVEMDGFALPLRRAGGHCVAWCMHPVGELGFSETGLNIIEVTSVRWIDVGYGTPG
jgi:hypothetical protein